MNELITLTKTRVKLFFREPEALFWVILFPVIMAVVLGFAFRSKEVAPSQIVVVGDGNLSEAVQEAIEEAQVEIRTVSADAQEEAIADLKNGICDGVWIQGTNTLHYDAAREASVLARHRFREADHSSFRKLTEVPENTGPTLSEVPLEGEGNRYVDWLFPGLLGMNIMSTGLWGIGFGIAEQRQKKLLRRFLVTPMRRSNYLLSFVLSRLVFLAVEASILLVFGLLVLDIPFKGGVLSFLLALIIGTLSFAGVGLLVAARPKTIEGISGILNFVMMPMWLCSGVFFAYERFPEAVQSLCRILPLTSLVDTLRGIMLRGHSILDHTTEIIILLVWGLCGFLLALKIFRWE